MKVVNTGNAVYIGADDSNHAGTNVKGEIILVTFSHMPENEELKVYPNRRKIKPEDWLNEGNEYFFTILTSSDFRRKNYNLVLAAPLLIKKYFESRPKLKGSPIFCSLDGHVEEYHESFVENDLREFSESVSVKGYVKKGRLGKRMPTPRVVYAADNLANFYFVNKVCVGRVLSDERMVRLSLEELLNREKLLRTWK